jgi:small subunit ribosomal protein S5
MRPVLEVAGVKDILSKSLRSGNRINIAKATIMALSKLKQVEAKAQAGAAASASPEEASVNVAQA